MFKKILSGVDLKVLSAAALPFAGMIITNIISPLIRSVSQNSPGMRSQLTVPVSAQGTGYFTNHPDQPRREKLCL